MGPVAPSRNRSLSVLLTQSSRVPVTATYCGLPRSTTSSAGTVLTNTAGIDAAAIACPGSAARTSLQFSSAGSFEKLAGSDPAGDHGPRTSLASSQLRSCRR